MTRSANLRDGLLVAALGLIIVAVFFYQGPATSLQLLVSAVIYALITLGLNVHWGYGGQFNFNVMGFVMLGGYAVVLTSYPLNMDFWNSDGPALLGRALTLPPSSAPSSSSPHRTLTASASGGG